MLEAEYRIGQSWRKVLPGFGIAKATWNQFGTVWTQHDWRLEIISENRRK